MGCKTNRNWNPDTSKHTGGLPEIDCQICQIPCGENVRTEVTLVENNLRLYAEGLEALKPSYGFSLSGTVV